MSEPDHEVLVEVDEGVRSPVEPDRLRDAVLATLRAEGVEAAAISVAVLADDAIAEINQEHLGHTGPTDVISFALDDGGGPIVGDIYIGADQAVRQAAEHGVVAAEEMLRLAVHGTLHVLGHTHPEDDSRLDAPMYTRQEAIITALLGR